MPFRPFVAAIVTTFLIIEQCAGNSISSASISHDGNVHMERQQSPSFSSENYEYGVDVSWPMHHHLSKGPSDRIEKDQLSLFESFMKGCEEHWSTEACEQFDRERVEMNLKQPRAMQNYTTAGYAKVKAPPEALKVLQQFWEDNSGREKTESWPPGNIYTNHWEIPTQMLRLGDQNLDGGGIEERRTIVTHVQQVLENWSRQPLVPTSLYGIRIYSEGAILTPHVDRMPLIVSAIINVAQDVVEPWILEVIGHDGVAKNVTMELGDMVLYEGSAVIHGRPYPLQGSYYANVFVHFEPVGHSERHSTRSGYMFTSSDERLKNLYNQALEQKHKPPQEKKFPYYVNSPKEESMWRQDYVFVREPSSPGEEEDKLRTSSGRSAHEAAANGNLERLKYLAKRDPKILEANDHNGWQPIHEAARSGRTHVVEYLIEAGVDFNTRANSGSGATPLWWAEHMLRKNHPTTELLRKHGAKSIGPNN